jgi:hypothetical protein
MNAEERSFHVLGSNCVCIARLVFDERGVLDKVVLGEAPSVDFGMV